MRAVIQRVAEADVSVAGEVVAAIGPGLLVLVGVTHDDTPERAALLARKIHGLRVLRDERSIADGASDTGPPPAVLAVSQFTLYGDARKGRRPTWAAAAPATIAEPLFDSLVARLRELGAPVASGVFGADMRVRLLNDGPMTLCLEL